MRSLIALVLLICPTLAAAAGLELSALYLKEVRAAPPTLSDLDRPPDDLGLAGARLGLEDNAKTGRFLGQTWTLDEAEAPEGEGFAAFAREAAAGRALILVDAAADTLLALADDPALAGALIFNVSAGDDRLRDADCRANVLHAAPSYAMRADALAQFMVKKRWTSWALIEGTHPADRAFAAALRAAGEKFRLTLTGEKVWAFDADMRRSAATEAPLFTQDLGDPDILVLADEIGDWARYVPYNTWTPALIAGSEGLRPVAWAPVVEQWGATQLQNRFSELTGRGMRPEDYAAWAAMRAIGEAATRAKTADPATLRAYMLGEAFGLAGFKGRPLTFRPWNGQLRQPIPLVHASALAALAPFEGFLHRVNELDTLGLDEPQSRCEAMR